MKKILSLGVAAAVLSMTAVAASATLAPVIIDDAAVAGETITVEIVATGVTTDALEGSVVASDNLTFVDCTPGAGLAMFNYPKFAWANSAAPAEGEVLYTLTFTVNAAADEEISVALAPAASFEAFIDAAPAVAVVVDGEADVTVEPTAEPTEEPTAEVEPTVEPTEEVDPTVEPTVEPTEEPTEEPADTTDNNVSTGVALAVVPAVLAGAAIVVAKKRK